MPDDLKSLVKNPLGIIALFIALIYGFAALLLGVAAGQLMAEERQPLIWFIVLFPIVVLVTFYVLVTRHHGKLYAPRDYLSDDSFLKTLSSKEQQNRLEDDIRSDELIRTDTSVEMIQLPNEESSDDIAFSRSNSKEKEPIAEPLDVSLDTLRHKYKRAEMLALSEIELTDGLIFRHQVSFGEDTAAAFDGVSINGNTIIAAEVKYLRRALIAPSFIREVLLRGKLAANYIGADKAFKLIIAIVLESTTDPTERLEKAIKRIAGDANLNVDIRVFRYNELNKTNT